MPRFTLQDKFGQPATTLRFTRGGDGTVRVEASQQVAGEAVTRRLGAFSSAEVSQLRIFLAGGPAPSTISGKPK